MRSSKRTPNWTVIVRIALVAGWVAMWAASLVLPVAVMGGRQDHDYDGGVILLWGWFGILGGQFGWVANLTLPGLVALTFTKDINPFLRASPAVIQILLAINASFWREVPSEAGMLTIDTFGLGYYLWFGAMLSSAGVLIAVSWWDARFRSRSAAPLS